jgi:hypothetical protein
MKTWITICLMVGILLCYGGLASAELITIAITGSVTSARGPGLPGTINVGDIFNGTYTYDTSTTNSDTPLSHRGTYIHASPCGFDISLAGLEFKTKPTGQFSMQIYDNYSFQSLFDEYDVRSWQNSPLPNGASYDISWQLVDYTHTAFSSIALPVTAPVLSDWKVNSFVIGPQNGFSIVGTVTQAVLVPEPVTSTLLLVASVFLLRRRQ